MMRWCLFAVVSSAVLCGCGARSVEPLPDGHASADAVVPRLEVAPPPPDVAACLPTGALCRGTGATCCTGSCDSLAYGYGPGRCVAPQPEGSYCAEDAQCASGHCVDELCRAPGCLGVGQPCGSSSSCCDGYCPTVRYGYLSGDCAPPLPAGEYCEAPEWCRSRSCVESVCAP